MEVTAVRGLSPDFWSRAGGSDAIVNQKALLSGRFRRRLLASGPRVFLDFDDAIWTRQGRPYRGLTRLRVAWRLRRWLAGVHGVTIANEVLAAYARQFARRVWIVPMALDLEYWRPASRRAAEGIRIGWAGSPGNVGLLAQCEGSLRSILARHAGVRLAVFGGRRPDWSVPFEYVPYTPGGEAAFVSGLDIGLLPLADEPYCHGKSPIKAIQYLSCAVPVAGNVVGASREILDSTNSVAVSSPGDWVSALERLILDPALRERMGRAGRERVERNHDLRRVSGRLREILNGSCPS
jgi:glycosyltransferase involved in cell wall biosynthesis